MYHLRESYALDYDFCKTTGHEGLRPYIEKLKGWDQKFEDEGFLDHWETEQIKIIQCDDFDIGYMKIETILPICILMEYTFLKIGEIGALEKRF